jgi:tRNA(fMet)-specific endonuclease VapC
MSSGASQKLVLDTSAYSHLRTGHEATHELVAAAAIVLLPTIVLGELEAAFRRGSRYPENRNLLEEFLGEPFVAVLDVTHDVSRAYGRLFARLRAAGTPIPINDVWIAACTMSVEGHLLTFDQDFERVDSLTLTLLTS